MAAVAVLVLGTSQLLMSDSGTVVEATPMVFASAAEVVVEDLDYADTVQVMQTEGDEGAVIIWVAEPDEEAAL